MKKRVLTLFLALALCLGLATPAFAAGEPPTNGTCGENLTWALRKGTLTISGSGAMMDIGAINPPPWYDSVEFITSIQIENGVTSIAENAFEFCHELTSVTIPNSVTNIGGYAFDGCTKLTGVTIPNSVTNIGNGAFCSCIKLTSVTIPDNVTGIGGKTFLGCTGLTSITIPGSVTEIGNGAFSGCTGLTSVTIGSGVTRIWDSAFFDCTGLTDVYYGGSEEQWMAIEMGENDNLTNATIHFNSTGPKAPTPTAFTDTPDWCAKEAQWAVDKGITNGAGSADRFAPTQDCAHEQILTFLWRAAGKPAAAQAPVTVASYYQDAVNWAYEKGFIDQSLQLSDPCTRAQAVWYIWKALGEPQAAQAASFSDVDAGAHYAGAVSWAVEKGVTKGYGGEDTFAPDRVCGRGEIACFLYRAYN